MEKQNVAVLFGGRSAEHKISIISAKNVINAIPTSRYQVLAIGISKEGKWYYFPKGIKHIDISDASAVELDTTEAVSVIIPQDANDHRLISTIDKRNISSVDVIFPVLHGTYGEDGAIQGWAKMVNLPCVGPSILGSAIGMDKDVMKRLLRDANIPNAAFISLRKGIDTIPHYNEVRKKLGKTVYVKPVNMGSSVGVSRACTSQEYDSAIKEAFLYDQKVIIEAQIDGREIECAVLGNDNPQASIIGEIVPKDQFYSYEAKYIDANGAALHIPADLSPSIVKRVQKMAIQAFRCLECTGMTRVDMFLTDGNQIFINEINTIPGFTSISMYPSLWEASGISNEDLVDQLIQLAIEEHRSMNSLYLNTASK